jgi:lipoprotein-anchoring transpeptidase ErfK/SrfK
MRSRAGSCALAAAVAVLALLLSACGSGGAKTKAAAPTTATTPVAPTTAPAPTSTVPPYPIALSAVAKDDVSTVAIYDSPTDAEPSRSLSNPNPFYGPAFPRVFLVQEQTPDWLKVMLPMRPNGTTGWIKRADVDLQPPTDYRILVELGAHRLTLYEKNDVVMQEPVGVGTSATPSTAGSFYTTELIKVLPDQQDAYGPYAFGLSAYSEVHYSFGGGDGQMGIHGTGDPSSVGRDVSNGCIRMTNDAITQLANIIPGRGVPVEIRA